MIKVKALIDLLKKNKSDFFSGVPDSVLKMLSSSLQNKKKPTFQFFLRNNIDVSHKNKDRNDRIGKIYLN